MKGKYAIASMVYMTNKQPVNQIMSLSTISKSLDISKIYLEQVFFLLKRDKLVAPIKGTKGGYMLATSPSNISILRILKATDPSLFTLKNDKKNRLCSFIEQSIAENILNQINYKIDTFLENMNLEEFTNITYINIEDEHMMYYI
jgi:Rrf2 family protein